MHEQIAVGATTVPVWILGLDDLKKPKREAGRPEDLDDLLHLP